VVFEKTDKDFIRIRGCAIEAQADGRFRRSNSQQTEERHLELVPLQKD